MNDEVDSLMDDSMGKLSKLIENKISFLLVSYSYYENMILQLTRIEVGFFLEVNVVSQFYIQETLGILTCNREVSFVPFFFYIGAVW
jgi:hypothetical protein